MTDTTGSAPDQPPVADGREEAARPEAAAGTSVAEAAAREAADLKDRLLRTLAEMENLRRRADREVADARLYGIANFARDLLAVADNMRRALDAITPEVRDGADGAIKALIDGIELTERELNKALDKNGVRRFEPVGEKFDPNLHQAMYEMTDPTTPAGMVAQVVQAGYLIGERVLRPALVGISKGGPKAPPTQPPADVTTSGPNNDNVA